MIEWEKVKVGDKLHVEVDVTGIEESKYGGWFVEVNNGRQYLVGDEDDEITVIKHISTVVEPTNYGALVRDGVGVVWVRAGDDENYPWRKTDGYAWIPWESIGNPEILYAGIPDDPNESEIEAYNNDPSDFPWW